jgi:uncharacterized protein (DUF433 family)
MKRKWQDQINICTDLHHGDACIKGTRIPVTLNMGSLADGLTEAEILAACPQLKTEHIQAAVAYATDIMRDEFLLQR